MLPARFRQADFLLVEITNAKSMRPAVLLGEERRLVIEPRYWLSSFFACLWTEMELRSINKQKEMRLISSHADQTSFVEKGFAGIT